MLRPWTRPVQQHARVRVLVQPMVRPPEWRSRPVRLPPLGATYQVEVGSRPPDTG